MKKFISKPAALIKYMLLAVLAVSFIAACGYDDVNEEKAQFIADYYAEDGIAGSALIGRKWINVVDHLSFHLIYSFFK